ncbi:MAG: histidine phosphatase family protein [Oscillospiraceae bacterium]|nr:histidine phosphatase family protein [Oscillospiraceae bacterium]
MRIYFLRHAETQGNLERRYIGGRTDEPLSGEGKTHAALRRDLPALRRVYVSPMKRAAQTAEIFFPDAELVPVEGLREMDFGDFEGKNADEMKDDPAYRAWVDSGCEDACPGGEDMKTYRERACAGFFEAVAAAEKDGADETAVVAHGGTIMAVMSRFGVPERRYFDWRVSNCGGYLVETEGKRLRLLKEL